MTNLPEERQAREEAHVYVGHDPLLKAERETLTFNKLWFTNGERQSLLQKVGSTIFSLLFVAFGLCLVKAFAIMWAKETFSSANLWGARRFLPPFRITRAEKRDAIHARTLTGLR
jgi:hypothetical protein